MIYLDTSVALAHLLSETMRPAERLWKETLVSSRLLEYELWVRVNQSELAATHGDLIRSLLARLNLLELSPPILVRALAPFPKPVRTLDALHLASMEFLRGLGQKVECASYDARLIQTARSLGIEIYTL
jgi:predicted nucleic acid-binding protein